MNVTIENVAACRKKLNIEISAEEVSREWNGVVTEFQKYAQIPGFRVGHAPLPVLERRFQKEISDEVQRKLIPQFFREAIAKEKLKVVSVPSIDEVKFARNEPLHFLASIDVAPEFPLPPYKGLKVKKRKVEVKEEEVENALQMLAEQQASFSEIKDRGLTLGDFAVISYSGICEGKPIVEFSSAAKPVSENKQFWLLMAKDSFLPGFCEPLVGAHLGEKKQVSIDFPIDFRIKELSGKKATYFVEILGIREKKLPSLDDTFAASYKATDLAELKEKIKTNMIQDREHQSEENTRHQIVEQLLKTTSFDLPESAVHTETRHTVFDIIRENQIRGVGEDALREKSKEIFDFAQQSAKDKVRASFILSRIAEEEKITVKDEEIQEQIRLAAQRTGKSAKELVQQLEERDGLNSLREELLIRRTLDLLVSHAIVETE